MRKDSKSVPLEEIRAELERIRASQEFANANRASRFLQFVVEEAICGRADQLKEYTVGVEVFDRAGSFDPRSDSVVRVEARRLRAKLEKYYDGSGKQDPVRIELPKGTYAPSFHLTSSEVDSSNKATPSRGRIVLALVLVSLTVAATTAAVLWFNGEGAGGATSSIAVLPFLNLSTNPANEVFSDGLVDEITQSLSRIEGLRVAARTSAFRFRGKNEDVRSIGRQLNVSTLLEGSVREMGARFRITAQLINADDGFHLWARSYECDRSETFTVQEQISRDIAKALAVRLVGHDARPLRPRHSENARAQELYLRGRHHWNKRTAKDLHTAAGLFEQAIEADPGFAMAYAALADTHTVMAFNDQAPVSASIPPAKEALSKALTIDDSLAEAYATLAWIRFFHDWQWEESESLFQRSIELNPNYSTGRQWYALSLTARGRFDEARREFQQARLLDPLSPIISTDIGVSHYFEGNYQEAIRYAEMTLDHDPDFFYGHSLKGSSLVCMGKAEEAVELLEKSVALSNRDNDTVMRLAHACTRAGKPGLARQMLEELKSAAHGRGCACLQVAAVHAALDEQSQAMEWLQSAIGNRQAGVAMLYVDPVFLDLRELAGFPKLMRHHGLDTLLRR